MIGLTEGLSEGLGEGFAGPAFRAPEMRIAILLDRSGSMSQDGKWEGVQTGWTAMVRALKKLSPMHCQVRLDVFHHYRTHVLQKSLEMLPDSYPGPKPDGSTACREAFWALLKDLKKLKAGEREQDATVVILITDGEDGGCGAATDEEIRAEVKRLEATGHWTFVYIAMEVGMAVRTAKAMGFTSGNIANVKMGGLAGSTSSSHAIFTKLADAINSLRLRVGVGENNSMNMASELAGIGRR